MNQLDGEKADYDAVIEQLREDFGSKVVPIQYPIVSGPNFNAMIDVLLMKMYSWGPDGGTPTISDIPADQKEKALELHKQLVEAAAENDEALMEKFFDKGTLTEDEMREGIRKGLITRDIFPVFCVSALRDMGVRRMMEFLGNVVPFCYRHAQTRLPRRYRGRTRPRRPYQPLFLQNNRRTAYRRGFVLQGYVGKSTRGRRPPKYEPRQ